MANDHNIFQVRCGAGLSAVTAGTEECETSAECRSTWSVLSWIALFLAFFAAWPASAADDYLLGPQDKIRLKVYEWRASRDAIFEWTALNDVFTVGADGSLSLPFAGNVPADGISTSTLEYRIGENLKQRMGLGRIPDVSVEIAQYRPFFVVGKVTQPGEYPYRPGLSVLQALSIAGGLRIRDDQFSRFEREVIAGRGDVELFRLNKIALLARKARLEAEQANASEIEFPETLTGGGGDGSIALVIQQERAIFQARREGQETQIRALEGLQDFLQKELVSLNGHLAFQDRQIELVQKELSGISSLVKKGFATESRQTALERSMVQARGERLTAETSLLRAQQEISRTEIAILELRNRFANEVRVALRETQTQLDELESRAQTASRLLYDSEVSAPSLLAKRNDGAVSQPVFTIVRGATSEAIEIEADEATEVRPGDTVKIELKPNVSPGGLPIATPDPTGTSALRAIGNGLDSLGSN